MDDRDDGPLGEARKHYRPREKLRWPVVVAPLLAGGEPAGASTLATTRGISVGGAFIETDGVFEVGTALHLWLHPPGHLASRPTGAGASRPTGAGASRPTGAGASRPTGAGASRSAGAGAASLPHVLRLRAEVRWINDGTRRDLPRGFGVEFRALTADDEIALHSYFSRAYKVV